MLVAARACNTVIHLVWTITVLELVIVQCLILSLKLIMYYLYRITNVLDNSGKNLIGISLHSHHSDTVY